MSAFDGIDRRTIVRAAGLAASTAVLSGCIESQTVDDDVNATSDGSDRTDDQRGSESDDEADEGRDDSGDEDRDDIAAIEPGSRIQLRGTVGGWEGLAPAVIEGETNPTLVLEPGATYEIGWVEGDGNEHNIELRDENQAVVDGYQTALAADPGPDQFIEFEASDEVGAYVCQPHENTMRGEIRLKSDEQESASSDDGDDEDGDEGSADDGVRIEPGTRIELAGQIAGWEGLAPASIDGMVNPTLVLEAGESYVIAWVEGDGSAHNIELRTEDDDLVAEEYRTEVVESPGPEHVLEFEASEETAVYTCWPHEQTMRGRIHVE